MNVWYMEEKSNLDTSKYKDLEIRRSKIRIKNIPELAVKGPSCPYTEDNSIQPKCTEKHQHDKPAKSFIYY